MSATISSIENFFKKIHSFLRSPKVHAIASIFFLLMAMGFSVYSDNLEHSIWSISEEDTVETYYGRVSLRAYIPKSGNYSTVVLGVHGFTGNKNNLKSIAMDIVNAGMVYVGLDLPGHGQSEGYIDLNLVRLVTNLEPVVRHIESRYNITRDRIIGLGHSLGGGVSILLAAIYNFSGVIAFAPAPPKVLVNTTTPRNVLVIIGNRDQALTLEQEYAMMKLLTGQETISPGVLYGNFTNGSARKIEVLNKIDHFRVVTDVTSRSIALQWICNIVGINTSVPVQYPVMSLEYIFAIFASPFVFLLFVDLGVKLDTTSDGEKVSTSINKIFVPIKQSSHKFVLFLLLSLLLESLFVWFGLIVMYPLFSLLYPVVILVPFMSLAISCIVLYKNQISFRDNFRNKNTLLLSVVGSIVSGTIVIAFGANAPFYTPSAYRILAMVYFAAVGIPTIMVFNIVHNITKSIISYKFKTITGAALFSFMIIALVFAPYIVFFSITLSYAFAVIFISIFFALFITLFVLEFFTRLYGSVIPAVIGIAVGIGIMYVLLCPFFPSSIREIAENSREFMDQVFWKI